MPKRRMGPIVLAAANAGLIWSVCERLFIQQGCKYEFIKQVPAEQYPLAGKARSMSATSTSVRQGDSPALSLLLTISSLSPLFSSCSLRRHCPDHPVLKDIPASADDPNTLLSLITGTGMPPTAAASK